MAADRCPSSKMPKTIVPSVRSFPPRSSPHLCLPFSSRTGLRRPAAVVPIGKIRFYATHKDNASTSSSSASQSDLFARLQSQARLETSQDAHETVGPFPLGVGPSGRRKAWRRWSDLNIGGKLVRAGQQTGNLGVILVGGGLLVVLTIALTTELFAKNSPSVLYSQAVDRIRQSGAVSALGISEPG